MIRSCFELEMGLDVPIDFDAVSAIGDTLEQAVARCVVQMRLGDEVDVPDELVGESK